MTQSSPWPKHQQSVMRRDGTTYLSAMSLLILLRVNIASNAEADESFIQADVYNALYEAYIQCDDDFGQSRSEFITEKLEHDSGQITIASLKKILNYNVEVANQAIAQKLTERESYVSEIIGAHNESEDHPADLAEKDKESHKEVREIDTFLKEQRKYVEVHECVLEAL